MGMLPMLATIYDGRSPRGYWVSEKYRGVRCLWDGRSLLSRNGRPFPVPPTFTADLPSIPLDGELWLGYGTNEYDVMSIVGSRAADPRAWRELRFMLFDMPVSSAVESRVKRLQGLSMPCHVHVVAHIRCRGRSHLEALYDDVVARGGEGVMLRKARGKYEHGRSDALLKLKPGEGA